jgi:hypothetical protein
LSAFFAIHLGWPDFGVARQVFKPSKIDPERHEFGWSKWISDISHVE